MTSTELEPLILAARAYYWKPMAALFRSLELRLYLQARALLAPPVLDLGCGDGQVGRLLRDIGIAGAIHGLDYTAGELRRAQRLSAHRSLSRGDAGRLPFGDDSFASVVSNGVVSSLSTEVEPSMREVARVLVPGGALLMTVPTDRFADDLWVARGLGRVSRGLRARYVERLHARLTHRTVQSIPEWVALCERHALRVETVRPFFSAPAAPLWNTFSLQAFRACATLRWNALAPCRAGAARVWRALIRDAYEAEAIEPEAGGYVFIVARA